MSLSYIGVDGRKEACVTVWGGGKANEQIGTHIIARERQKAESMQEPKTTEVCQR